MAKLVSPMAQGQTREPDNLSGREKQGGQGWQWERGLCSWLLCTSWAERARWPLNTSTTSMIICPSAQFTGGICETLGGFPPTHPKLPCAGWLWGEASACPWRQEKGTHPMMGVKVGGHQARGEVRLSQRVKRPRELGECPSITWAQCAHPSFGKRSSGSPDGGAWAWFEHRSPGSSVCPSIVWAQGLTRAAQRVPGHR